MDYEAVGFMCGLEVHQQLLTERKMFCHCPAGRYTTTHDGSVLRHMRPTLSELGEYDGTALMEFKTRKNIIYLLHKSNVCTYEMDDTPPFLVNQQAVDIAIEQCLMLGCDIVDEVHVARKQYLDGSIPTGFQRTAIVGVNGKLPFRGRDIRVVQVSVEEDSCREVKDKGHLIVWRADRLGMPLIETVTAPDLKTPEEVEEAILLVGRVCRSTGHVRTGIGASRQDVNVSVRGGTRVEIKGVPKANWAPALVHGEAVRQVNLLKLRDELHARGFKRPEDIATHHADVTDVFTGSELVYLRRESWERLVREEGRRPGFELGNGPFCVRAVRLTGLQGTLSAPTQPNQIFAGELAGRVRVIADLDQPPVLIHGERWPEYRGSLEELRRVTKRLKCGPQDAVVVVWGPLEDTLTAAEEIRLRYVDATKGVPSETRQPFPDGRTDFERILPGPDRMYPDTDSQPTPVTRDRVERLKRTLAPYPWVREQRYRAAGIPTTTVYFLIRRNGADLVDRVVTLAGADVRQACFFFGERLKGLSRRKPAVKALGPDRWCEFFALCRERPSLMDAWERLARSLVDKPDKTVREVVEEESLGVEPAGWRHRVPDVVKAVRTEARSKEQPVLHRLAMGRLMRDLRGRVRGRDVAELVGREIRVEP
jgi:glutamyl-tRNA(Gln) amidotransferase subunit E